MQYKSNVQPPHMQKISVLRHQLTENGLYIEYLHQGTEVHIIDAPPTQACHFFETIGEIEGVDYPADAEPRVLFETEYAVAGRDGEPVYLKGFDGVTFSEWVKDYELTERMAAYIAAVHEQDKELAEWKANLLSIPSLIRNF
jgi:hypothetical protein